jgi:hypothetical protein
MHLHGVRALLDAGANPRERLGLLVNDRVDPACRSAAATASPPMPAPMMAIEVSLRRRMSVSFAVF